MAGETSTESSNQTVVLVKYWDLPPRSLRFLESSLEKWRTFHAETFPEGYVAPEVVQGSQKYVCSSSFTRADLQVVEEHTSTVGEVYGDHHHHVGLKRKRSPLVTTTSHTPFHNVLFEQKYGVPEYDRDSSTERNKLLGISTANIIKSRCFNCGSYSHSIKECWKQHDADQIENRRQEFFVVIGI